MLAEAFSMMRTNRKAINEVCLKTAKQRHPNELSARMHAGSLVIVLEWMRRSTSAGIANLSQGAKVKAIQEDGAEFTLQFEDGSTVTVELADPGASVAVPDKSD